MKRRIQYDSQQDYYKLLEIPATASPDDIQQAYRRLAKKYHPDLNQSRLEWATARFQALNEAYDTLSDAALRRRYDQMRLSRLPTSEGGMNWWDIPHEKSGPPPSPAANPPKRPSPPPVYRPKGPPPGEWLKDYRLYWLRPVYLLSIGLFFSPYRFVLFFLVAAIGFNGMLALFFFDDLTQEAGEQAAQISPTPPPPATASPSVERVGSIIPLRDCGFNLTLNIQGVDAGREPIEILAISPALFLSSEAVSLAQISQTGLPLGQVQILAAASPAEIIFLSQAQSGDRGEALGPGDYLLQWTALGPDQTQGTLCHQVIRLPLQP